MKPLGRKIFLSIFVLEFIEQHVLKTNIQYSIF
jgi:hypothetical protein